MLTDFVLRGGRLFDGDRFSDGDIRVHDGRIASIGVPEEDAAAGDTAVFDVSGCIVSAGLIDIHTHFSVTGLPAYGVSPELATVPFGVTAAVDAGGVSADRTYLDRLSVRSAVFVPLPFENGRFDFARAERLLSSFGDRALGVKLYFDEKLHRGISRRHLRAAAAFAGASGVKMTVHSSNAPVSMCDIVGELREGDILTHAYHGGRHTMEENGYKAYAAAKDKGVWIDVGMAGGVHTDFSLLKRAVGRGCIPDTISSDITCLSAYVRGGVYGLPMCMHLMRTAGMDEAAVFRAVTKNAARAVQREKAWFGMAVGDAACLSVMREEPSTVDIVDGAGGRITEERSYVCKMTVIGGRILYRNGCRQTAGISYN